MKKSVLALICLLALFASIPQPARAFQDTDSSAAQPATRSWPTPDEVVSRLDKQLSLTDDQKAKITPIIAERQQKLQDLAASSGRRRRKARKAKSILEDSDKKIKAILTDEQKQKYTQMQQQMRAQMKQRMQERQAQQ